MVFMETEKQSVFSENISDGYGQGLEPDDAEKMGNPVPRDNEGLGKLTRQWEETPPKALF